MQTQSGSTLTDGSPRWTRKRKHEALEELCSDLLERVRTLEAHIWQLESEKAGIRQFAPIKERFDNYWKLNKWDPTCVE